MTTHLLRAALLASVLTLSLPAVAAAKSAPADVRVVDGSGKTLAETTQYTDSVKIKTNRRANCFGPGTGGSGRKVDVPGKTALGIVADASKTQRALRPLMISDHFDFGLAVCGFGNAVASQSGFWYLKHNHAASMTGGELTNLKRGDSALWYLIEDFNQPTPVELELRVPAKITAGRPVPVRVFEYADDGTRSAAAGAMLPGTGAAPTDAQGRTSVNVAGKRTVLRAERPGAIPSNAERVCAVKSCAGVLETIAGTGRADRIKVRGQGRAQIKALGGKDVVDLRKARRPALSVNCGPGRDTLIFKRAKKPQKIKGCERIKRR
jgi:hypothetical protein